MTIFQDKFSFEPTKQFDLFVLKFLKYFNIIFLKRFPKKIKKGFLIEKKTESAFIRERKSILKNQSH